MTRILWLLIETLGGLLAMACLLRAWGHRQHLNPRHPLSLFVHALTDWLIRPLQRALRPSRTTDWASLFAAALFALILALLQPLIWSGQVSDLGQTLLRAAFWLARSAIYLAMGLVVVQAILSWVNPHAPMAPAIRQLSEPLLAPFRRRLPAVAGVDLSPLALFLLLQILLILIDPAFLAGVMR
jgi:YggT family protein